MYVIKEDPSHRRLVLDTDFDLNTVGGPMSHLRHVEGVAEVNVVNRYLAKIEVGRLFTMAGVKAAVEQALTICGEGK